MQALRKMAVGVLVSLLSVSLFTMAWSSVGSATIRNKQTVKSWFDKSDFYNQLPDVVIASIENNTKSSSDGSDGLPISDPAIQKIVKDALSSGFLKTNIDAALDSIYTWLGNDQPDLSLKLDLTTLKNTISSGLSDYAKTRASGLPVCGAVGNNSPVDPFSSTCLPKGVTPEQVGTLASDNFLKQDFLKDPTITADSLKIKDKYGNSVPATSDVRVKAVRKSYHYSGFLPLALAVLSGLLVLGIIFLSVDRLKGIKRTGSVFLTSGIIFGVLYGGLIYLFNWAENNALQTQPAPTDQVKLGVNFAKVVLHDIEKILLIYAIAYVAIGVGGKVVAHLLSKRNKPAKHEANTEEVKASEDKQPGDETPEAETPEEKPAVEEQLTPKPPRKIQL